MKSGTTASRIVIETLSSKIFHGLKTAFASNWVYLSTTPYQPSLHRWSLQRLNTSRSVWVHEFWFVSSVASMLMKNMPARAVCFHKILRIQEQRPGQSPFFDRKKDEICLQMASCHTLIPRTVQRKAIIWHFPRFVRFDRHFRKSWFSLTRLVLVIHYILDWTKPKALSRKRSAFLISIKMKRFFLKFAFLEGRNNEYTQKPWSSCLL